MCFNFQPMPWQPNLRSYSQENKTVYICTYLSKRVRPTTCSAALFGKNFAFFNVLKGSRQWESRGVRNVSNCPNLARTAAFEVRFSLNFAVVFDFIYFRFRPSKAKSIGNVLPNRQNAAKRAQGICWRIKDGYTCAGPIYWRNDACCANR